MYPKITKGRRLGGGSYGTVSELVVETDDKVMHLAGKEFQDEHVEFALNFPGSVYYEYFRLKILEHMLGPVLGLRTLGFWSMGELYDDDDLPPLVGNASSRIVMELMQGNITSFFLTTQGRFALPATRENTMSESTYHLCTFVAQSTATLLKMHTGGYNNVLSGFRFADIKGQNILYCRHAVPFRIQYVDNGGKVVCETVDDLRTVMSDLGISDFDKFATINELVRNPPSYLQIRDADFYASMNPGYISNDQIGSLETKDHRVLANPLLRRTVERIVAVSYASKTPQYAVLDKTVYGTPGYEAPEGVAFESNEGNEPREMFDSDGYALGGGYSKTEEVHSSLALDMYSLGWTIITIFMKMEYYHQLDTAHCHLYFRYTEFVRDILTHRGVEYDDDLYRLDDYAQQRVTSMFYPGERNFAPFYRKDKSLNVMDEHYENPEGRFLGIVPETKIQLTDENIQRLAPMVLLMHKLNVLHMICPDWKTRVRCADPLNTLANVQTLLSEYNTPKDELWPDMKQKIPTFTIKLTDNSWAKKVAESHDGSVLREALYMGPSNTRTMNADGTPKVGRFLHAEDPMLKYLSDHADRVSQCADTGSASVAEVSPSSILPPKRPIQSPNATPQRKKRVKRGTGNGRLLFPMGEEDEEEVSLFAPPENLGAKPVIVL